MCTKKRLKERSTYKGYKYIRTITTQTGEMRVDIIKTHSCADAKEKEDTGQRKIENQIQFEYKDI